MGHLSCSSVDSVPLEGCLCSAQCLGSRGLNHRAGPGEPGVPSRPPCPQGPLGPTCSLLCVLDLHTQEGPCLEEPAQGSVPGPGRDQEEARGPRHPGDTGEPRGSLPRRVLLPSRVSCSAASCQSRPFSRRFPRPLPHRSGSSQMPLDGGSQGIVCLEGWEAQTFRQHPG